MVLIGSNTCGNLFLPFDLSLMWAFYQALGVQGLELLTMVSSWRKRSTSELMPPSMATLTSDSITTAPRFIAGGLHGEDRRAGAFEERGCPATGIEQRRQSNSSSRPSYWSQRMRRRSGAGRRHRSCFETRTMLVAKHGGRA